MSECNHNCATCTEKCDHKILKEDFLKPENQDSHIKSVIAIVSGKGGVGKSMVTSLIASTINKQKNPQLNVGILDADITGPSIPKCFGIHEQAKGTSKAILPAQSKNGIEIMSANLLLENENEPIIWRGPMIAGVVEQFWTDVVWGDLDYLFIDMPPGTGDVPLTVFQSIPIKGIIIVSSPQDLVSMIVEKAIKMANKMDIPVLGLVLNMAYFECPNCLEKHYIFGETNIEEIANEYHIDTIASLPIDGTISSLADGGLIEEYESLEIKPIIQKILNLK